MSSQPKWIDTDFPANNESLISSKVLKSTKDPKTMNFLKDISWKRALEFSKDDDISLNIDFENIDHTLVKQGGLSDCYFVNSLLALAQRSPEALKRLFVSQDF